MDYNMKEWISFKKLKSQFQNEKVKGFFKE